MPQSITSIFRHFSEAHRPLLSSTILMVLLAPPLQAQEADSRSAKEAVDMYFAACFATGGKKDLAEKEIAGAPDFAQQVPQEMLQQLHPNRPEAGAWFVRGGRSSPLLLDFDGKGACNIRVSAADSKALTQLFIETAKKKAATVKQEIKETAPTTREENGTKVTSLSLTIGKPGASATLGLISNEKPMKGLQHILSFRSY